MGQQDPRQPQFECGARSIIASLESFAKTAAAADEIGLQLGGISHTGLGEGGGER